MLTPTIPKEYLSLATPSQHRLQTLRILCPSWTWDHFFGVSLSRDKAKEVNFVKVYKSADKYKVFVGHHVYPDHAFATSEAFTTKEEAEVARIDTHTRLRKGLS